MTTKTREKTTKQPKKERQPKQKRVEFTAEEKSAFVANNLRVNYWADRELVLKFDEICKARGVKRSEGLIKIMEAFVKKHG